MDRDAFALLRDAEAHHWWFRARRELADRMIRQLRLPAGARLLDAGCGVGGMLPVLAQHGAVHAFEPDAEACREASSRGIGKVVPGGMPTGVPFADGPGFDLVTLFDVLEHLEDPVASLRALRERLVPGGRLLLTVPAQPWLWGPHDAHHRHYRRYDKRTLRTHLEAAGLTVDYLTGTNVLLLPLAILQRFRERWFGYRVDDLHPSRWLGALLHRVWTAEFRWVPPRVLPTGLSLLAVAHRPVTPDPDVAPHG